jgi:diphosphomevalonate decarboxylase
MRDTRATAIAHSNIALVKYWGKRDQALNLPAVGSISATLQDLVTRTRVTFSRSLESDILILNGRRAGEQAERRVSAFLDLVRERAHVDVRARIESENNFPESTGLASSASAFASIALAASRAASLPLSPERLSELARRGSGSAARSVFGGFVEMQPGSEPDGSDAVAAPLVDEAYWPLSFVVVITSAGPKETGSTEGMIHSARTSPYYSAWVETSAQDLEEMRSAIYARDLERLGTVAEHSCLKMHALALSARPGLLYWEGATVAIMRAVRELRERGVQVYFSIDAGPQVMLLCEPGSTASAMAALAGIPGVKKILASTLGPGAQCVEGEGA